MEAPGGNRDPDPQIEVGQAMSEESFAGMVEEGLVKTRFAGQKSSFKIMVLESQAGQVRVRPLSSTGGTVVFVGTAKSAWPLHNAIKNELRRI